MNEMNMISLNTCKKQTNMYFMQFKVKKSENLHTAVTIISYIHCSTVISTYPGPLNLPGLEPLPPNS